MSKEAANKLILELQTNEELKAKIKGFDDPEQMIKAAVEAGYDVTLQDLTDADKALRAAQAERTDEKLSLEDLESVAGGKVWFGEDAPDGHEMGCEWSYHHEDWQKEHDIWCSNNYYCKDTILHDTYLPTDE
ncbi:MAG: Nif11-like leader peptide family RiPP precursor [Ruminiclostridium sp.]|nr:Nif11-like leader peptide family RiPP precursor [Ruminiclostridium sp.]